MILLGSVVNSLAIIGGSLLGTILRNISEQTKDTVTKGIGLGVIALGLQMAIKTDSFTLIIISLCLGAMVGEGLKIEAGMNRFGLFLQKHFAKTNGNFAEGFVTSTLIFVIGSMGIIGAIQSGVSGDHANGITRFRCTFFQLACVYLSRLDHPISQRVSQLRATHTINDFNGRYQSDWRLADRRHWLKYY